MTEPVLAGSLVPDGAVELLRRIEELRTSGVLRFRTPDVEADLVLVAGQLALDQPALPDGRDPVELFLSAREGRFEVLQKLPVLPVSGGDDSRRTGSLAVHVPADLMTYCERAGLTGTLTLRHGDRFAEAVYDRGELVAMRVDGSEERDLHEVFGWEEGSFEIVATPVRPPVEPAVETEPEGPADREPTRPRIRRADETGRQFLRVVEVALARIHEERERRRSPTRSSPPLPDRPATRPPRALSVPPPPRERRDNTVRIIYLRPNPSVAAIAASDDATRHVSSGAGLADRDLPEARPERRSHAEGPVEFHAPSHHASPAPAHDQPDRSMGTTLGWVLAVLVLLVVGLALLARLPPVE
ncbi:MAG: DUF4388 domain-containing protein [Myxococcota bacterium]|nr:DUF4388 domain-containing protein [Myxococcota bacterium]MDW8362072.1 hypothetical protein [Myxococcales bacterium]